jgi:hypothetical protein
MTGQPVFATFDLTHEELVGFHPYIDLQAALSQLHAWIAAGEVDPTCHFQVLEVGTDAPASSTGIEWYPEPLLRASVFRPDVLSASDVRTVH